MKLNIILAMVTISAVQALAADPCVVARLQNSIAVPHRTLQVAQFLTMDLYQDIGVALKWEDGRARRSRANCVEILVQFESHVEPTVMAGALAYATPYQVNDVRIHVFIDRVLRGQQTGALAEANLGYVLAHEIGHALEGVSRHSGSGVMQSHTPRPDLLRNRMMFAREDVTLIHDGLLKRLEQAGGR